MTEKPSHFVTIHAKDITLWHSIFFPVHKAQSEKGSTLNGNLCFPGVKRKNSYLIKQVPYFQRRLDGTESRKADKVLVLLPPLPVYLYFFMISEKNFNA